jgi:hypothetical protein
VDATGAGDPIVDRLNRVFADYPLDIIPVVYNSKNKHEMATLFYEELRAFRIRIPCHQSVKKTRRFKNFVDQFFSCEKTYKGQFMQLEHPDTKGAKDDYVDSLLLLLYGVKHGNLVVGKLEKNVFFSNKGFSGKKTQRSIRYEQAVAKMKKRGYAKIRRSLKF